MIVIFEKIFLSGLNPALPSVYNDGLSYIESIAILQDTINGFVDTLNALNIEDINTSLADTRTQVTEALSNAIKKFETDINAQNKFVGQSLDNFNSNVNNYVDNQLNDFKEYMENNTNVYVIDPTSGAVVSIQTALDNVISGLRTNAITCADYDSKQLTATAYDGKLVSAYAFDNNGSIELQ